MKVSPLLAIFVVGGVVALVSMLWDENKPTGELRARPRAPLSTWQQEMYRRLRAAFPEAIVLAQVALTAMISTPRRDRRRYHHKVIDFVLLDPDFTVRAAIVLDEGTQASRHAVGESVKELLRLAGYRVFEFNRVPEVAELRALLGPVPAEGRPAAAPSAPAHADEPEFPITRGD